jgi:tetratricopeptide (TPR) repeat protein
LDRELLRRLEQLYATETPRPDILAQAKLIQKYQDKVTRFDKMSPFYQQRLRTNLEAYREQYPDDTNGDILLARVLSLAGNDIKSKEILEQVLARHPDDLWANLALSTLFYKAEDISAAMRCLQNALFYYPGNEVALARLKTLERKK